MLSEMNAKAQTVEECARAQYAIVAGGLARDIGKRVWRGGDRNKHRFRGGTHDLRDNSAIDRGILIEQLQPPLRIAAIRGAAGFFIDARSDKHHASTGKCVVITVR